MHGQEDIAGKIAAAFRLVGEDPDFRKSAGDTEGSLRFDVNGAGVRGLVNVDHGVIRWSSASAAETADLQIRWRSWEDLRRWTDGIAPLWWYRLLGGVELEGRLNPVLQEVVYLFRNILRSMLERE